MTRFVKIPTEAQDGDVEQWVNAEDVSFLALDPPESEGGSWTVRVYQVDNPDTPMEFVFALEPDARAFIDRLLDVP